MIFAQVLGVLYGALAVAPYVILVQLGQVLLDAARAGVSPDRGEVMDLLMWLISAFGARYGIYFVVRKHHPLRGPAFGTSCALAWLSSIRCAPSLVYLH